MTAKPPPVPPRPFRFTRAQYRELAAVGFFDGTPVELVFGRIFEMRASDERHSAGRYKTIDQFQRAFDGIAWVGRAGPVDLPDSDPRPDLSVFAGEFGDAMTSPTLALLVVEVSDATLDYDLTTKAEMYATAGVPEYWVLDVEGRQLHVFRDPQPLPLPTELAATAYRTRLMLGSTESVSPLAAPSASILVSDLLP